MDARDVFEILVREHADMLGLFVRSVVRDPHRADDLVQETFLVAWRRLADYDRTRPFGPWLRGIASKLILAERHSRAGVVLRSAELLEQLALRCEALQRRSGDTLDERLDCLKDCLADLPEPYRAAVDERYRSEGDLPTSAERLGIPLDTLKKRLQRARTRLAECLSRKLAWTNPT